METSTSKSDRLITEAYNAYRVSGIRYIYSKTDNYGLAEDLVQDAFVRMLECKQMLRENTIKYLFYTILRNLYYDYLRRHYKKQEITFYLCIHEAKYTNETESTIITADLSVCEKLKVNELSTQRRRIYTMSRYEEKTTVDIAKELHLSIRTVENHLFFSRKIVREYIRECI